jgi:hypothetical protein
MTILNQTHSDPVIPAKRAATRVKRSTAQLGQTIIQSWEQGFDIIWNNPRATPAEVLAELGTDAVECFDLSNAIVALLADVLPDRLDEDWERIQGKIAAMPARTRHDDGSVTIED